MLLVLIHRRSRTRGKAYRAGRRTGPLRMRAVVVDEAWRAGAEKCVHLQGKHSLFPPESSNAERDANHHRVRPAFCQIAGGKDTSGA
jgi:hypothetical protein